MRTVNVHTATALHSYLLVHTVNAHTAEHSSNSHSWSTTHFLMYFVVQSSWPAGQYAAAVVAVHLAFALLEKQRLENFEERGEVSPSGPPAWQSCTPQLQLLPPLAWAWPPLPTPRHSQQSPPPPFLPYPRCIPHQPGSCPQSHICLALALCS